MTFITAVQLNWSNAVMYSYTLLHCCTHNLVQKLHQVKRSFLCGGAVSSGGAGDSFYTGPHQVKRSLTCVEGQGVAAETAFILPPSLRPSLRPSVPPCLPPSLPPCLPASLPPSLHPSLPPSYYYTVYIPAQCYMILSS